MCKILAYFKERWPYYGIMLFGIIFTGCFFHVLRTDLLDADMSSEMVLGRLLRDEGGILSKNWLYSTELRVLSIQLVYKLFFYILNDWHWVRTLSVVFSLSLLAASYAFFAERFRLGAVGLSCALLLLLPFSREYGQFVIMNGGYIPHITFMFLTLALLQRRPPLWAGIVCLLLNSVLAFMTGLSGVRYLLILYLPLCLTSLVLIIYYAARRCEREEQAELKKELIRLAGSSLWLTLVNAAGVLINVRIFTKLYSFVNYVGKTGIKNYSPLGIIKFAFVSFGKIFGAGAADNLSSAELAGTAAAYLFCGILFVLLVFTLIYFKQYGFEHKFVVLFGTAGFLFNVSVCSLTDILICRYVMPSAAFLIPAASVFLIYLTERGKRRICLGVWAAALIYAALSIGCFCVNPSYRDLSDSDPHTVEGGAYEEAAAWLNENGYTKGLGTFWHSNMITELSDGRIEMWIVRNGRGIRYKNKEWIGFKMLQWLQKRSHIYSLPRSGKVFLLLISDEADYDKLHLFADKRHLVYSKSGINIYGYVSYKRLLLNVCGRNLHKVMKYGPQDKQKESKYSRIWLRPGYLTSGPSLSLPDGKYKLLIECEIKNGQKLNGEIRYFDRGSKALPFELKDGLNEIPFKFDNYVRYLEFAVGNANDEKATLVSTKIVCD
ncbi:hypothetical protein IJT93_02815 [bacterium]|nr:hypothetical protein [bacterium]